MIRLCYCGNSFKTYPSKLKLGRGKYCSKKCALKVTNKVLEENGKKTRWVKGSLPWLFKGFRYSISRKSGKPYKLLYMPDEPSSDSNGYIREHRFVMEKYLGRILLSYEIVHHRDGNTLNNSISNLQVMDKKEHDRMNVVLNIHKRWVQRKTP